MTMRALRLTWWLRNFFCYFHGGGVIKRDPAGNINWQCRKCGRWSDPVPMVEEDAVINADTLALLKRRAAAVEPGA